MSSPTVAARRLPVALIGLGGVGQAILRQLTQVENLKSKFEVVVIANSKKYYAKTTTTGDAKDADAITLDTYKSLLETKGQQITLDSVLSSLASSASSSTTSCCPPSSVFIDSTSDTAISAAYPSILKKGIHVVTPNKKATSSELSLYQGILDATSSSSAPSYYGESTVGAGLPILSTLQDLVDTGDQIELVQGVFSGTLSYIFNEFSPVPAAGEKKEEVLFSDVVKVAKEQGYTEPDPRDDLSGTDVARKLCILSRLIPEIPLSLLPEGYASIPTSSLVPDVLSDCKSKEEYLQRLAEGDAEMKKLREEAEKEGKVVRYVGVIDVKNKKVEAKLEKFPFSHPFASSLSGSDNILSISSERYKSAPLIIQGSGAGAEVTAMGVTSDLLKVYRRVC